MDTTLVGVTLISLAMAGGLSVIVWRMLRDERARSEARVAVLATMAAAPVAQRTPEQPLRQAPPSVGAMFAEPEETSHWGTRLAVMAALTLVLASVVLFALAASGTKASARAAGATTPPAAGAASSAASLELLSLRDTRQGDTLTITGLVHNPRQGSTMSRVAVAAYTFDDNGSFLASGRALLDVTMFTPGDDSPFVVTVPVTGTVARYRIGFRTEDGRVISHVDRRQQASVQ